MRPRLLIEWIVLAVSGLAIALLVGVLVAEGLNARDAPPSPVAQVRLDEGYATQHGWVVPIIVRNEGDAAAEAVLLEASAMVAGEPEAREIQIDFLPSRTEVDVAVAFSARPDGEVRVQIVGFRLP